MGCTELNKAECLEEEKEKEKGEKVKCLKKKKKEKEVKPKIGRHTFGSDNKFILVKPDKNVHEPV